MAKLEDDWERSQKKNIPDDISTFPSLIEYCYIWSTMARHESYILCIINYITLISETGGAQPIPNIGY